MRKSLICFMVVLCGWGVSVAYTPFTPLEHLQIDRQLNIDMTTKEKKEKSDFFALLAQKSLQIRKAFIKTSTKITSPKLTAKDKKTIASRVQILKNVSEGKRNATLDELLKTQQMASELARALQIESSSAFEGYARTVTPTPLFWLRKDDVDINGILGGKGATGLRMDDNNLIRELAVVLPPDTVVTLIRKVKVGSFTYYQVRTREFDIPAGSAFGYFTDARFLQLMDQKPLEREMVLPSFEEIKDNLLATVGSVYVRGGSWYEGISEIDQYYPSLLRFTPLEKKRRLLQGVDCSGLLYQATNGYTPRNTSQLLSFGEALPIEGKTVDQILSLLKPLDLIVWNGHVVIILDGKRTIESRGRGKNPGGVEIVDTRKRLTEIFRVRKPVDDYFSSAGKESQKFVIKRWFSEG